MVKMHHPLAQVRGHCPKALRANGTSRREASRCLSLQGLYAGVRGFRVPVTHYTLACSTGTRYVRVRQRMRMVNSGNPNTQVCQRMAAPAYGEFREPTQARQRMAAPALRQRMVNSGNPNTQVRQRMAAPAYGELREPEYPGTPAYGQVSASLRGFIVSERPHWGLRGYPTFSSSTPGVVD